MNRPSIVFSVVVTLAGIGTSTQAAAITVNRDFLSHGPANCQSSLPVFDGNIRKRPMAIGNEGTSNAFITCDTDTINNSGPSSFTQVAVVLSNRDAGGAVTVDCTVVDGFIAGTTFLPKTTAAIAVGDTGTLFWGTADNAGLNFRSPALNCNLPAGIDISAVFFNHTEDVGL